MEWLSKFLDSLRKFKITSNGDYRNGERSSALPSSFGGDGFLGLSGFGDLVRALVARLTGNELTGAQREANAFNAAEAQKSRDFTEYMTRNKYQMETQSMESAGVNPAMVYGGGNLVPTAANGAQGTSSQPDAAAIFDVLPTLVRLPHELKVLNSEAQRNKDEGQAALETAAAATKNAESNALNASTNARNASVNEIRVQIERDLADSNIKVNNKTIDQMASNIAYMDELRSYVSKNWEVAKQNANAATQNALNGIKLAEAAVQNAATNDYLSTYQSNLMFADEMLKWYQGEGQNTINKYLDERQRTEIDNLLKEGLRVDAQRGLIDKQGNLVDALKVKAYINAGTDILNSACNVVSTAAEVAVPVRPKVGFPTGNK